MGNVLAMLCVYDIAKLKLNCSNYESCFIGSLCKFNLSHSIKKINDFVK